MKILVLSEGVKDVKFMNNVFSHAMSNVEIDTLSLEQLPKEAHQTEEAERIRNFNEKFNPYHILIKSEGGKSNLKRTLSSLIKFLSGENCDLVVLLDLDGGNLYSFIDEINEKLEMIYGGNDVLIEVNSEEDRVDSVCMIRCDVIINGMKVDDFSIVGFPTSLEDAAGIGSHDDAPGEINKRIKRLAKEDSIADPIIQFVT